MEGFELGAGLVDDVSLLELLDLGVVLEGAHYLLDGGLVEGLKEGFEELVVLDESLSL